MGIEDPEVVNMVNQIEELEKKFFSYQLHKVWQEVWFWMICLFSEEFN